jgi:hypothetical protein
MRLWLCLIGMALACAPPGEKPAVDSSTEAHTVVLPAAKQQTESTTKADTLPDNDPLKDLLQGESGWITPGQPARDNHPGFVAGFMSYNSGAAYIKLDSAVRLPAHPDSLFATVDSLAFRFNPRRPERVSGRCNSGSARGPIFGVVPDTTPDRTVRATRAWIVDTIEMKIRPIPADSVMCTVLHGE